MRPPAASPERFGAYSVFERVGSGGMATVHRATVERDGRTHEVALKRLLPELAGASTFAQDFVREAKIAAQLDHPNIVRVFDIGSVRGVHYIAMELLRGAPLQTLVRTAHEQQRPVPIPVIVSIISDLVRALDYAQNGRDENNERFDLVHRDISPSNVYVTEAGRAKIIDFGVAKMTSGRFATQSGLAKGKLGYMSSEAIAAEDLDARADLFSVGVIAWELIVGKRLFKVTDDWMPPRADVVRPPAELAPRCPRSLSSIVLRALAPDRAHRWPSATAFAKALEDVRRGMQQPATQLQVARWVDELIGRTDTHTRPRYPSSAATPPPPPRRAPVHRVATVDVVVEEQDMDVDFAYAPPRPAPARPSDFDDARTIESSALDDRFDSSAFAADDRSVLGEESPFFPDDDAPTVRPEPEPPAVQLARRIPRERALAQFAHEPSEPSMQIYVTRPPSVPALPPPPKHQFELESSVEIIVTTVDDVPLDTGLTRPYDLAPAPFAVDDARTTDRGAREFGNEDTRPARGQARRRSSADIRTPIPQKPRRKR